MADWADDGEWRIDPARPAVVVGTIDMIGSRIMFFRIRETVGLAGRCTQG